jgi:hypothetical protein
LRTFRLGTYSGINPVEADLVFRQLQLGAIDVVNGTRQAVVNNIRFTSGETRELKLADDSVRLVCLSIEDKSALFGIAGTPYVHWLRQ